MRLSVAKALVALGLTAQPATAECVVLLHGLARSDTSLAVLEGVLRTQGYHTVNPGYPSRQLQIEELVAQTLGPAVAECGDRKVHFVTHSMGGILVRAYLEKTRPANLGRVVMLAPPNQGSELVDTFGDLVPFEWLNGPAGRQLGTTDGSVPSQLGGVDYPVGIIAGNVPLGALGAVLIDGPHDGKVSVESTKLTGMRSHITLSVSHTFMMNNPIVMAYTLRFLREEKFGEKIDLAAAVQMIGNPLLNSQN